MTGHHIAIQFKHINTRTVLNMGVTSVSHVNEKGPVCKLKGLSWYRPAKNS